MAMYRMEFFTSLSEVEVTRWFEDNITHEHDDFVLRYLRDGLYFAELDGVYDRDLVDDNADFAVMHRETSELEEFA